MEKPATILHKEFREKIVEAINTSGLPAFVLVPVLESALNQVKEIADEQYANDIETYTAAIEDNASAIEDEDSE